MTFQIIMVISRFVPHVHDVNCIQFTYLLCTIIKYYTERMMVTLSLSCLRPDMLQDHYHLIFMHNIYSLFIYIKVNFLKLTCGNSPFLLYYMESSFGMQYIMYTLINLLIFVFHYVFFFVFFFYFRGLIL